MTSGEMKSYMIMLRGNWQEWNSFSPEETQKILAQYGAWVETLKKESRFKNGSPLTDKSRLLKSESGKTRAIDGPYSETKEAITGYFIIQAVSLDEATEIARACPALTHGESVEIVEMG